MRRGWPVRIVIVDSPLEAVKFSMPVPVKLSAAGERLYHKRYIEEATLSGRRSQQSSPERPCRYSFGAV